LVQFRRDLSNAVVRIDEIDKGVKALSLQMASLANRVTEVRLEMDVDRFNALDTASAKAAYLRAGGLAHINEGRRAELLRDLQPKATQESVIRQFDETTVALDAVASFAGNILHDRKSQKLLNDVSRAATAAKLAYTAFGYFTGATTGIGALQSLGSLSSMFGQSGSDPMGGVRAELEAIKRTLAEMNRKLDEILENQRQLLAAVNRTAERVEALHVKVDNLGEAMNEGFSTVLEAVYAHARSGCSNLLTQLTPGGGVLTFPFAESGMYTRYHYLNPARLDVYLRPESRNCFQGLELLVAQPRALDKIAEGLSSQDSKEFQDRNAGFRELRSALSARLANAAADTSTADVERALLIAGSGAPTLQQMRKQYAATLGKPVADAERPCPWRRTADTKKCWWSSPQKDGDYSKRLLDETFLDSRQVLTVADYVLSLYPQALVDGIDNPLTISAKDLAARVDRARVNAPGGAVRQTLENTMRLVDISAAHEGLVHGNVISYMLAQDLLHPPVSNSAQATASDRSRGVLSRQCVVKWGSNPAAVAAPANYLLYSHPKVAQLALRIVVQSLVFPDPAAMDLNSTAAKYELARTEAPSGNYQRQIHGIPPHSGSINGSDSSVRDWWRGILPLDPISTAPGIEQTQRGYELHYAAVDGMPAQIWKITKKDGTDSCDGYGIEPVEVKLPRGWSISAGGLVMALPSLAELHAGFLTPSGLLHALQQRAAAIRSELASLIVAPPASVLAPYEYALGREAQSVLTPGVAQSNSTHRGN
jgi:hypothetical protein